MPETNGHVVFGRKKTTQVSETQSIYFSNLVVATPQAKPFLKWAGGKGQLIESLADLFPSEMHEGKNPDDLSSTSSLPKFLDALEIAVKEMYRVLKPGRFCAILIGDTRKGQHYIPLSHFVLQRCLRSGFVLKEEVIKTQHNTTHAPRWSASAKHYKFYFIMHEPLFIFRKPAVGENLSRIQYSTWKGVQRAQATEVLDDLKGLFDLEGKKSKSRK